MGKNGLNVYEPDRHGLEKMACDADLFGGIFTEICERVAEHARDIAPYDPKTLEHYRDSFHVGLEEDDVLASRYLPGITHRAVVGVVYSDDPNALDIELGTPKQPEGSPLRREGHHTLSDALHEVVEGG